MESEEKKKLWLGVCCSFLILLLLMSGRDDHFQKVIHRQTDEAVVKKLEDFRKGGIERSALKEEYDSELIIANAISYEGTPHRMAGSSRKGIDCSGLVMVAHQSQQISLPHGAEEQARYGTIVPSIEELERGDLVFFYGTYATSRFITHSGIYLGEYKFIHASSVKGVVISDINNPYYTSHFIFGTRLQD